MGTIIHYCKQKNNMQQSKRMISIITHYNNKQDYEYDLYQKSSKLLFSSINDLFPCKYLGRGIFGSTVMAFVKSNKECRFALKIVSTDNIIENYIFLDSDLIQKVSKNQYLKNRLVKVHAWSTSNTKMHIVIDLMKKGDLYFHLTKLKIKNGRFFPQRAIKRIALQLLLILEKLHQYNIIYRNLRSQNVFLANEPKYGLALSDYFFSINDKECLTYFGSAEYAPPQVYNLQKTAFERKFNQYDISELNEQNAKKQKWVDSTKVFFKDEQPQNKIEFIIPHHLKKNFKSIQLQELKNSDKTEPVNNNSLFMNVSQPIDSISKQFQFGNLKQKDSGQFQHKQGLTAHQSLEDSAYTKNIDIWMLGIMLFQLIFHRTPFQKTKIAQQYLNKSRYFISKTTEEAIQLQSHILHRQITNMWAEVQKGFNLDPKQKDFIQKLLIKNSQKRPTIQQLKNHQFLKDCQRDQHIINLIYQESYDPIQFEKQIKNKDNSSTSNRTLIKKMKYSRPFNGTIPQKFIQYEGDCLSNIENS